MPAWPFALGQTKPNQTKKKKPNRKGEKSRPNQLGLKVKVFNTFHFRSCCALHGTCEFRFWPLCVSFGLCLLFALGQKWMMFGPIIKWQLLAAARWHLAFVIGRSPAQAGYSIGMCYMFGLFLVFLATLQLAYFDKILALLCETARGFTFWVIFGLAIFPRNW